MILLGVLRALVLCVALLVAGCSASTTWLENRVACTVDGGSGYILSRWGPVAVGSIMAAADAVVICRR